MRDLVIVGAGPAGIATAIQATRLGLDLALLDATGRAGGLIERAWRVENMPGVEPVPGGVLATRMRAHLDRLGITVGHARVREIRRQEGGLVVHTEGEPLHARAVVIATGTRARPLTVPGPLCVHTNVRALLAASPQEVAIIGGGEAALDQALTLSDAGVHVHLVVRGPRLRARGVLVSRCPATIHLGTRALRSTADGTLHLDTPTGPRVLTVDGLLAAIGRAPSLPILPDNRDGIHVIGDARLGGLGQLGIAIGDGLTAAMRAASKAP